MNGRYYSQGVKVMIFIIDFWLIGLAFFITRKFGAWAALSSEQFKTLFIIFGLIWIIAGFFNKIYRIDTAWRIQNIGINLFKTFALHLLLFGSVLFALPLYSVSALLLISLYALSISLIVGFRIAYKLVLKYIQSTGFDQRKVIIVGVSGSGNALHAYFTTNEMAGYVFVGFFDYAFGQDHLLKNKIVGGLDATAIKAFCIKENIDEIYFALPTNHQELMLDLSKFADDHFIYFRVSPDFGALQYGTGNTFLLNSIPVVTTRKEPLGISINAHLKRFFDLLFSLVVIVTLFPIIVPIIALAIRLDSPGPIFFKQLRPGKKNKLFDCYKFRTMRVNKNSELQATKSDSRITKVGQFLRKTNMDELPQFFNVLLGNMSVVGPRPNMISQLEQYSKTIGNYGVRHFVTPGITGYAQVNGFRGETKEEGLMEKRVEYDVRYIENWSLRLDLKIIFLTVWNMVRGEKNAY